MASTGAGNCPHTSYYACKAAACILYKTSPWVCVARYFEDYPLKDWELVDHVQRYGISLKDHPDNCPRARAISKNPGYSSDDDRPPCVVHQIVAQRNQTKCLCDIWSTGCICGVFVKEQQC